MPLASLQSRGYLPVATASLVPAAVLNCELYIQRPGRPYAELYRGASYPFELDDLNRLRADGVDHRRRAPVPHQDRRGFPKRFERDRVRP